MAFDLLIRGGTVVDGTGVPGLVADLAVQDGRIVGIGAVSGRAREIIDADGLTVAPGFIDNHTHYDAQLCWDPWLTPSSWHGVTTAVLGNCGLGVAPVRDSGRQVAVQDLVSIEGMAVEALTAGVDWDWETYPQYLNAMRARRPAINVGFLAGLTPLRHYVMGEDAIERGATPAEIERIGALLDEALDAGALGFSTSRLPIDIGYKGKAVASRLANDDELAAYARRLGRRERGIIQVALLSQLGVITDAEHALIDRLQAASGNRPLTWLALLSRADMPDAGPAILERCDAQCQRGARPAVAVRPLIASLSIRGNPLLMGELPVMQRVFNQDPETQMRIYAEPEFRAALRADMAKPGLITWDFTRMRLGEVSNPALGAHIGRTVAQIAAERGAHSVDTFLDLALEDRLEARFNMPFVNTDDALCAQLFKDPRTIVSLSDGGAHADMLCDAGFATYLLGYWVRERQAIGLEAAVRKLTADQADFYGLHDRGRIRTGLAADLVLFDAATVGSPLTPEAVSDFPAGCRRYITRPTGIEKVVVGGEVVVANGQPTGARPGTVVTH